MKIILSFIILTMLTGCEIIHSVNVDIPYKTFPSKDEIEQIGERSNPPVTFSDFEYVGYSVQEKKELPIHYEIHGLSHYAFLLDEPRESKFMLYHNRRCKITESERKLIRSELENLKNTFETYMKK